MSGIDKHVICHFGFNYPQLGLDEITNEYTKVTKSGTYRNGRWGGGRFNNFSMSQNMKSINKNKLFSIDVWICAIGDKKEPATTDFMRFNTSSSYVFCYSPIHIGSLKEAIGIWNTKYTDLPDWQDFSSFTFNKWTHIYLNYKNIGDGSNLDNTIQIYKDGDLLYSYTSANKLGDVININFGSYENNTILIVDEIRISDILRHTSNFTPPTEPFTIDQYKILDENQQLYAKSK